MKRLPNQCFLWEDSATITVTMDTTSTLPASVTYSSADGTATAGSDYISASGVLTFTPGITEQTFTVPILDDTLVEPRETISLTLAQPTNATLDAISAARLTILDDDAQAHVFLPLLVKHGRTTTLTGVYSLVGNPCTTDPCLPAVVFAVGVDSTIYHSHRLALTNRCHRSLAFCPSSCQKERLRYIAQLKMLSISTIKATITAPEKRGASPKL